MPYAVVVMGIAGLTFGLLLGFAARAFSVQKDPRVDEILAVLPGANCGACGYPGCEKLAEAIVRANAPTSACPVGRAGVAGKVAEIMDRRTA